METEICAFALSNWQIRSIDDVCIRVTSGGTPSRTRPDFYADGSWPWVKTQELQDTWIDRTEENITDEAVANSSAKVLPPNTILLAMYGATVGQLGIVRSPMTCNQACCAMIVDSAKADFRFLYYHLRHSRTQLKSLATGAAQQNLSGTLVKSLRYPFPPLAEQKAIAMVLGAMDDKIELNRRMNATLEAMARALFQSWFVDFDPVRAKLDLPARSAQAGGRQPAGMDADTAVLFPEQFAETELGHIPHGWQVKTIEELAERVAMGPFGSDIKVATFVPAGIPVISGQHLRGTLLDESDFNFVSVEHADRLKRSNVQRGDIIFTHAGSIGQVAYIPESSRYGRYILSQRQFYMRCNRALVSPFYISSYFKTPEGQHRLLANTSSTGVPSISQPVTYLRQLRMVVPPPALLAVFDAAVSRIHLKMAANDHQSRILATLRDTLLPKLLSGELSVAHLQN